MWPIIYKIKDTQLEPKVRRNCVCFCHCLSTLILTQLNINTRIILLNSASYFIWDMWYIASQRTISEVFTLVHHVIATVSICTPRNMLIKHKLLNMMELSNVPTYIVYDLIKSNNDSKTMRLVQLIWFGYFRTVKIPLFIYHICNNYNINTSERIQLFLMTLLGYIWTGFMGVKLTSMV